MHVTGKPGAGRVSASLAASVHLLVAALSVVVVVNAASDGNAPAAAGIVTTALFVATYAAGVWPDGALPLPTSRGRYWIALLTVEWLVLLCLNVEATYLVFALFFLYMRLFGTVRGPLVVALTTGIAMVGFGLHRGFTPAGLVGPALGAAVAIVIGLGYEALTRDAEQRQRLIDELTRTRTQLATAERAAGVLDERERLAREVHDTVSQSLSSIIMLLHAAQRAGAGSPHGAERVEQARQAAMEALAETREFIHALAPPALRAGGIADALLTLARQTEDATGLRVEVTVPQDVGVLPTPVETALLRIAQGALANVAQHAHATRVDVTLTRLDDDILLDVVDDGDGFESGRLTSSRDALASFGLATMRDRAASLGGTLTVESSRGHGTNVVASFTVST